MYDLRTPGRDYQILYDAIKSYGVWGRITESCWAIVTSSSYIEIRNNLMNNIDKNDRLMVVRAGGEGAWLNAIADNEWLKVNLVK